MKLLKLIILLTVITVGATSCSKKDNVEEVNKLEIQKKQIQEIIPEQYLDSLKKLGLSINSGISPVNVEGYYAINPLVLESTNIPKDFIPGHRFSDARVSLTNQNGDFGIRLLGKNFVSTRDTSIATAISGTGDKFTVYGKIKSTSGTKTANFAIIFSGTFENKTIKNFKYGLICISNKNSDVDNPFIKEGYGRIITESDLLSTTITEKNFLSINAEKQLFQSISSGMMHSGTK